MSKKDSEDSLVYAVTGDGVDSDFCKTFVFKGEGHTLGNALRTIITRYPEVRFCGYTIPHPSEHMMHLRVQTMEVPAIEVVQRGLQELKDIAEHIGTVFQQKNALFNQSGK